MKVLKMKNRQVSPDMEQTVKRCVETMDGMESAHINMATGEITYDDSTVCVDEDMVREAFCKAGIELEDR